MGASTVRRLSGSAWNWLSVVALPSCGLTVLDTLKLLVRLEMKVVLPRPDSPGGRGGSVWGGGGGGEGVEGMRGRRREGGEEGEMEAAGSSRGCQEVTEV